MEYRIQTYLDTHTKVDIVSKDGRSKLATVYSGNDRAALDNAERVLNAIHFVDTEFDRRLNGHDSSIRLFEDEAQARAEKPLSAQLAGNDFEGYNDEQLLSLHTGKPADEQRVEGELER